MINVKKYHGCFAQKNALFLCKIGSYDIDFLPSKEQNIEIKRVGLTKICRLKEKEGVKRTV